MPDTGRCTSFMKNNDLRRLAATCIAVALLIPAAVPAAEHLILGNGVEVILYTPLDVHEELTERDLDGSLYMRLPGELLRYRLVEDIDDDVIVNKGDGIFHPIETAHVLEALEAVDVGGGRIDHLVEVYILPYPRYYPLASSANGNRIFLSPGVFEVTRDVAAHTVTHEFGHTYQNHFMPDGDVETWCRYLTLRGIYQDPRYTDTAEHMFRPKEVFAEDFRYLFGGEASRYSGTIENAELLLPTLVPGLESFIVSLAGIEEETETFHVAGPMAVSNHPNPFNPATVITLAFGSDVSPGERRVEIKLYNVEGRLVRTLYSGVVSDDRLSLTWNGTDENGAPVASGIYLYRAVSNVGAATGKMLLLR